MSDYLGSAFFVLLLAGIYFGIRTLANPGKRSQADFERRAGEGGLLGAGLFALNKLLNPEGAKATEVVMDLKGGRYNKKRKKGKSGGNASNEEVND